MMSGGFVEGKTGWQGMPWTSASINRLMKRRMRRRRRNVWRRRRRRRVYLTINKWLQVGKHNALSGNTGKGIIQNFVVKGAFSAQKDEVRKKERKE